MPNIYYQPEAFGLTTFGQVSDPDSCYSFDDVVVWERESPNGNLLCWAADSGCSCPSPFEDVDLSNVHWLNSREDLKGLQEATIERRSYDGRPFFGPDAVELLASVVKHMKANNRWDL